MALLEKRAAGYLMKKELDFLGDAVNNPKRPFVAIIGGAGSAARRLLTGSIVYLPWLFALRIVPRG